MAHEIIIIMPDDPGLTAPAGGSATGSVKFIPSHELTPTQQIRRAERAEKMLSKIRTMLEAPASAPDGDD